jgi:hypothetical protein
LSKKDIKVISAQQREKIRVFPAKKRRERSNKTNWKTQRTNPFYSHNNNNLRFPLLLHTYQLQLQRIGKVDSNRHKRFFPSSLHHVHPFQKEGEAVN